MESILNCDVIFRNIPHSWDKYDALQVFGKVGLICEILIPLLRNKSTMPYCIIKYAEESEANVAVNTFDGVKSVIFDGILTTFILTLDVELLHEATFFGGRYKIPWINSVTNNPDHNVQAAPRYLDFTLVIKNMPCVTKDTVKILCKKYGVVCAVNFKRYDEEYIIFVRYKTFPEVLRAALSLNGYDFEGRILDAKPSESCCRCIEGIGGHLKMLLEKFEKDVTDKAVDHIDMTEEEQDVLWEMCNVWETEAKKTGAISLSQMLEELKDVEEGLVDSPLVPV